MSTMTENIAVAATSHQKKLIGVRPRADNIKEVRATIVLVQPPARAGPALPVMAAKQQRCSTSSQQQ